ncbi:putative universel stress protein UspA-like [Herminiimonas arsenicoxydans]|uniref:Universel stress protein UspA-like n=1 Tax=Herminiimonas arsenicoxydans TaxID=204773 RepID=A4G7I2_HERAR|nr:putative universel stress protein UspA-like [Herminiimonas arsenicoxydans]
MLKTILLATDGSDLSKKAVTAAIDFAASYGSKIVGLSVAEVFPELFLDYDLRAIEEDMQKRAVSDANFVEECAKKAGVACEVHTVTGVHPYQEIIKAANDFHCDAIFMASHGKKGIDKILLGSETQKVLAHSTIPVLVYR